MPDRFSSHKRDTAEPPGGPKVAAILERLEARLFLSTTPNDTRYSSQWGLGAIDAADAWDYTTGSYGVIVAHIDTGLDYTHPDLYQNVWINQAEIPAAVKKVLKDVDKDGLITFADLNAKANRGKFGVNDLNDNGYIDAGDLLSRYRKNGSGGWEDRINGRTFKGDAYYTDDIIGWDFANNDNDPFDFDGHGTHTAGIIGAMGNNDEGISGVNWRISLMAINLAKNNGDFVSDSIIAKAIHYSADAGANVSNNSWGSSAGRNGDVLYQAISYAGSKGQIFVAAAGNEGVNADFSRLREYPASYNLANIISVAATTSGGSLARYSTYGPASVDIAAPGSGILSTVPGGKYESWSGTSMATPFVTGAVALLLAQDSSRSISQIKSLIIDGADESALLRGTSVAQGELNLANALAGEAGATADASSAAQIVVRRPGGTVSRVIFLAEPIASSMATGISFELAELAMGSALTGGWITDLDVLMG